MEEEEKSFTKTQTLQQVLAQIQIPHYEDSTEMNRHEWAVVGGKKKTAKRSSIITPEAKASTPEGAKAKQRVSFASRDSFFEIENQKPIKKAASPPTLVKTKFDDNSNETVVNIEPEEDDVSLVEELHVEVTLVEETREEDELYQSSNDSTLTNGTTHDDDYIYPLSSGTCTKDVDNEETMEMVKQLQERVRQLEEALATAEALRQAQQLEHAKELFREREQAEERQQALQLRLYISETRLKTYEDALAEHIHAVRINTASGSSSPDRSGTTSASGSLGKRPWETNPTTATSATTTKTP